MELILRYFPDLSKEQRDRFEALGPLYAEWNAKINLISRNDFVHLYERHVLHSLGIAAVAPFVDGNRIVDVGTGGGFPGVPLAIFFPQCTFHLIDGIGKKIAAVKGVIEGLGLTNATAEQVRSEDHRLKYDVIVSRAVTTLPEFIRATKHLVHQPNSSSKERGRILYLKGGELADEILELKERVRVHELAEVFKEDFFATKKVVEVRL
ncbi:MAG: 16S rRNA (guanine(527)-N(7))-methyltransferase RsmG [Flavobacteriales bacterium]